MDLLNAGNCLDFYGVDGWDTPRLEATFYPLFPNTNHNTQIIRYHPISLIIAITPLQTVDLETFARIAFTVVNTNFT